MVQDLFHQRTWKPRNSGPEKCPQRMVCKRTSSRSWVMEEDLKVISHDVWCVTRCICPPPHFETLYWPDIPAFSVLRSPFRCLPRIKSVSSAEKCPEGQALPGKNWDSPFWWSEWDASIAWGNFAQYKWSRVSSAPPSISSACVISVVKCHSLPWQHRDFQ